jgi:hypothetical protein
MFVNSFKPIEISAGTIGLLMSNFSQSSGGSSLLAEMLRRGSRTLACPFMQTSATPNEESNASDGEMGR